MRQLILPFLCLTVVTVCLYAMSSAQVPESGPPPGESSETAKLKIVPLVTVKPGETKELLLSTWCTVGMTRAGGFRLSEMKDGKPTGDGVKTWSSNGVTISVPDFDGAESFASQPKFSPLAEHDVVPFKVTISASTTAEPAAYEMHLIDATCAGRCKTDFRVLVVEKQHNNHLEKL